MIRIKTRVIQNGRFFGGVELIFLKGGKKDGEVRVKAGAAEMACSCHVE